MMQKLARVMLEGSDHYAVVVKMTIRNSWIRKNKNKIRIRKFSITKMKECPQPKIIVASVPGLIRGTKEVTLLSYCSLTGLFQIPYP